VPGINSSLEYHRMKTDYIINKVDAVLLLKILMYQFKLKDKSIIALAKIDSVNHKEYYKYGKKK